jgi:hypothetical protein
MFDDLRPMGSAFDDDEEMETSSTAETVVVKPRRTKRSSEVPILGMTAFQRLVIAIMLFLDVTVLGAFLLLATEAVVLPAF